MFETSSSRFVMWLEYLKLEVNEFHRENYYYAQICFILSRVFGGNKKGKVEDFLMSFKFQKKQKEKKVSKKEQIAKSKRFWHALTGFTKRKK